MSFDYRQAARDVGRDTVTGAQFMARTLSSASVWRRAGRSFKNSFIGSFISNQLGLLLLGLVFVGFWLNDRLGIPTPLLYVAGVGALLVVGWLNQWLWRSYTRSWSDRPKFVPSRRRRMNRTRRL